MMTNNFYNYIYFMEEQRMAQMKSYLQNNVYGVFELMINDLLINQPDDVVAFMLQWLKEKGQDVLD